MPTPGLAPPSYAVIPSKEYCPQGYVPFKPRSAPPIVMPPVTGRKKALLIGINYIGNPAAEIKGSINDVRNMVSLLFKFNFQSDPTSMLILTDDQQDPSRRPTRVNILNAFRWLVNGVQPGDSLFFHFSGHGSQVVDLDGDESDGLDETILPVDYQTSGQIIDDQIHDFLVKPLPCGARLTALMDCCHSGTGMDLPFVFEAQMGVPSALIVAPRKHTIKRGVSKRNLRRSMRMSMMTDKGALGPGVVGEFVQDGSKLSYGDALLFSGCQDDQTSTDTTICASYGNLSSGVMTNAFTQAVLKNPSGSYLELLNSMKDILHNGPRKYAQIPQLSSGRAIDMNQQFSL